MANTPLLGLTLPVTGTLSGTWGDVINNEISSLIDSAIAGTTTLSTDADVTLTTTVSAANQAREAILLCSGARTALRTITAPALSKTYIVINSTTGSQSVKLVGAGPTTGVTVVNGEKALVAWNGTDFVKVATTVATISLTTEVTGILPAANGGTGISTTPTLGTLPYGNGTTYALLGVGSVGQVLTSAGAGAPTWTSPSAGAVTTVSVATSNGFAGTVATPTTTPVITISTSVTGILKGNGTVVSAAAAGDFPTLNQNTTGSSGSCTGNSVTATTATNQSGGTVAATTLSASSTVSGAGMTARFATPGPIGSTTASTGAFTTVTATGNITAYFSDDRLKTRFNNIDDALAKVNSLSGFYYEANETAQALGYEAKREVGVSAQSVQAVMPEVVAPAPIDEQYLTVRYERLVPLLIEAIKELNAKVDSLEAQLKGV